VHAEAETQVAAGVPVDVEGVGVVDESGVPVSRGEVHQHIFPRVVVNDLGGSVTGDGAGGDPANDTAQEIKDNGGEAVADTNSVATPDGGQAIIDTAINTWGSVDILVNNAGTVSDADFDDMTDERLSPLVDVHLKGAFFVTRPAWKVMRQQNFGRIVNTSSAAGILGAPRMTNYGAAKTGIIGLTRVLTAEAAGLDIKVNAIVPVAATRMMDYSMGSAAEVDNGVRTRGAEKTTAEELMRPFLDRLDPALVAPVVAFLAHADCPVSGEIFTVGGGQVSRFFIGRTRGYYNPSLTLEDVSAHFEQIRDPSEHTIPAGPADEMIDLYQAVTAG
jgi:NAD(P)-dependent dehydrogenase (short-subunit alcohol dehydrogenase family)